MEIYQSPAEIAYDLYHIHNDRVEIYKAMLIELKHMGADIRILFERMIEESIEFSRQLSSYSDGLKGKNGNVYRIWKKPVVPDVMMDKKTIAKACADDELVLVNTYSVALSSITTDPVLEEILQSQQKQIMDLYNHLHQFHDAQ